MNDLLQLQSIPDLTILKYTASDAVAAQWRIQGGIQSWPTIQFGYRLWLPLQQRNRRDILGNILNCPPSCRMSGSAQWCGP